MAHLLFFHHKIDSRLQTESFCATYNIDLFVVVYSVIDRNTFAAAERVLQYLKENEMLLSRGAILVANKTDLQRHRVVTRQSKQSIQFLYVDCSN